MAELKRVVTVRLSDDEINFLDSLFKKGINYSTGIRFCIAFVKFIREMPEFKKMVEALPSKIKV
jgi:hypothetical protein